MQWSRPSCAREELSPCPQQHSRFRSAQVSFPVQAGSSSGICLPFSNLEQWLGLTVLLFSVNIAIKDSRTSSIISPAPMIMTLSGLLILGLVEELFARKVTGIREYAVTESLSRSKIEALYVTSHVAHQAPRCLSNHCIAHSIRLSQAPNLTEVQQLTSGVTARGAWFPRASNLGESSPSHYCWPSLRARNQADGLTNKISGSCNPQLYLRPET